jgi:hypothetical protein
MTEEKRLVKLSSVTGIGLLNAGKDHVDGVYNMYGWLESARCVDQVIAKKVSCDESERWL